jgi:hypothetical protein
MATLPHAEYRLSGPAFILRPARRRVGARRGTEVEPVMQVLPLNENVGIEQVRHQAITRIVSAAATICPRW